jgi:hypothetical protein
MPVNGFWMSIGPDLQSATSSPRRSRVAEYHDGELVPAGLVKFGPAGWDLLQRLEPLRAGPASAGVRVPVRPRLSPVSSSSKSRSRRKAWNERSRCFCRSTKPSILARIQELPPHRTALHWVESLRNRRQPAPRFAETE